ncbi:hypothetical protein GGX14DRAFT_660914 [Mycena pura]|uniref:Uncharacterized protein n=1 Tax=Mycena pura TaxID=153505 RepID=A0AAD6V1S2_9AGAR|nr:hypothetical protein GGX14DRAFT_660914 [Mycena pura]
MAAILKSRVTTTSDSNQYFLPTSQSYLTHLRRLLRDEDGVESCFILHKQPGDLLHIPENIVRIISKIVSAPVLQWSPLDMIGRECVTFLPQNHHHHDQCRPAVECPSERASSPSSRNVASGLLAIRATTSSHPRPEHIEPLTPTSLLHTRAHPELHAYSRHSHLFISFLPVARTFFSGAHREGKGIPCGLSSSLLASPAPMPVLYDTLAPSSVQHTQEPLFIDHIPFGASQATPWFWIPSPPSSPLPETHARSPTPLSHPPLAPSRISVAAPSAPIAPESSRKPRSRRCFICGKTKTHPLDFRVCPRTRELIEQKLVKYNGKWRLVLFDGSPLPMTRSRGGVASHLLSRSRIPIHVHSDAPPAQRAPRLASPRLNPSSSHRNLPHRVLLPHMPTAHVPTAVTKPSPAFPSPHIHPPHSSATPPSCSPVSFANKFTLLLFDFLVAARKHRNDLIHVRLILFFKHGISRARSIVPPTVEVPYEPHNHHHRDQCRPAVECPSERASSLPSRNVASGLLAIRATTSSHPRPEHIEPFTPTSLLHTRAHPELHAYSRHSHLFISFLVHLWTPPTHPRAQSDDYEPVARTFFNVVTKAIMDLSKWQIEYADTPAAVLTATKAQGHAQYSVTGFKPSLVDKQRISKYLLELYCSAYRPGPGGNPDRTEYVWLDEFCLSDQQELGMKVVLEILAGVFKRARLPTSELQRFSTRGGARGAADRPSMRSHSAGYSRGCFSQARAPVKMRAYTQASLRNPELNTGAVKLLSLEILNHRAADGRTKTVKAASIRAWWVKEEKHGT